MFCTAFAVANSGWNLGKTGNAGWSYWWTVLSVDWQLLGDSLSCFCSKQILHMSLPGEFSDGAGFSILWREELKPVLLYKWGTCPGLPAGLMVPSPIPIPQESSRAVTPLHKYCWMHHFFGEMYLCESVFG